MSMILLHELSNSQKNSRVVQYLIFDKTKWIVLLFNNMLFVNVTKIFPKTFSRQKLLKPFKVVNLCVQRFPYENEPWFYYSKCVVMWRFDYHLYNHIFTTKTLVNLWLSWFNYSNHVFLVLFVVKPWLNFHKGCKSIPQLIFIHVKLNMATTLTKVYWCK